MRRSRISAVKAHLKGTVGDRQDRRVVEAALRERLAERAGEGVRPIRLRDYQGELLAHGSAPYEFRKDNNPSYYVRMRDAHGERTLWGKELEAAIAAPGLQVGEQVRLYVNGAQPVVVKTVTRDEAGQVAGTESVAARRNGWVAERLRPETVEAPAPKLRPEQTRGPRR